MYKEKQMLRISLFIDFFSVRRYKVQNFNNLGGFTIIYQVLGNFVGRVKI